MNIPGRIVWITKVDFIFWLIYIKDSVKLKCVGVTGGKIGKNRIYITNNNNNDNNILGKYS